MTLESTAMTMNLRRRRLLAGSATALAFGPAFGLAHAQAPERFYPTRPVSLWVPWPAGGATDLQMRLLAELAGHHLGKKVVIENRPGAGGTLAMPVLQQAAPDGYTIAQMPQPVFRAPLLQKLLWDPIRDSTPIVQISGVTFGMVVPANSPFKSVEDVFGYARSKPGELTIATNGVGTTPHIVLDELFLRRNASWIHVPYKGTAEQMIAVSSGQVMVGVNSNGFAPFVDNGALRLLATFGAQRSKRYPQVPTLRELGLGIVATSPYGLAGPRGLHPQVVQVLHDAFKLAMNEPAHLAELERYDQELAYLNTEDYGRAMREAYAAEKRAVERLGLATRGS
jgi:tripartite-type tricarboxylate transporter receptor subunit TctC